mmetsp:Transcript_47836/g.77609  ORF Transcript_47836/g.77609 Transcript_47836/m.77609 type:complete len:430 (-) Transcript_47836:19-1308(-)
MGSFSGSLRSDQRPLMANPTPASASRTADRGFQHDRRHRSRLRSRGVAMAAMISVSAAWPSVCSSVAFLRNPHTTGLPAKLPAGRMCSAGRGISVIGGPTSLHGWSLFGWGMEDKEDNPDVDEKRRSRFLSYAEGEGDSALLQREGLRCLLECTDTFCLTKHWLPETTLENIYGQYAGQDGIGLKEFGRIAHDGLLLEGKLEEYERAFNGVDRDGTGVISTEELGQLFAGLHRPLPAHELERIVDEADVGHDGIDFADFLSLARTHLDLGEVVRYLETMPQKHSAAGSAPATLRETALGSITEVHGEAEINEIVNSGADVVVKLAFSWCRPCKAFYPRYEKFAEIYGETQFLRIVGNENESCKHYAKDVLQAKISPMFAAYSKGQLVATWNGANILRFVENMEQNLPSARKFSKEREAVQASDPSMAPK